MDSRVCEAEAEGDLLHGACDCARMDASPQIREEGRGRRKRRHEASQPTENVQDVCLRSFASLESFLSLLSEATDGKKVDVRELLLDLEFEEHECLWHRVHRVAGHLLCRECVISGEAEHAVSVVATLMVSFTDHVIDVEKSVDLPPAFLQVAKLCETVLVHIPDAQAQGNILRALEKICVDGFRGREHFLGRVVLLLLSRCAGDKMTSADVTRLYKAQSLFDELDWEDESINCVKETALQCLASSAFIRCKHGQDVLAAFYAAHPSFVAEVDSEVKKQVLLCKPSTLEKYAAGLHRGWKQAEGESKEQIESCVQRWGETAIKANHKAADLARAMMKNFHFYHLTDDCTHELLCRIYGPVLWRSLKVANSQVRLNAVKLLQYVFPLASKAAGVQQEELELLKEVQICRELLEDPSESVRRAAVGTVCTIVKNFWSYLPNHEVNDLLKILCAQCARDAKASTVRAAVAEGFAMILQNPVTHHVMSEVLSQVAPMLHDRCPAVRSAFVGLVKVASHCKVIDKSQVAPSEDLYMRLICEHAEAQFDRLQRGKAGTVATAEKNATPDGIARHLACLLQKDVFPVNGDTLSNVVNLIDTLPLGLFAVLANSGDSIPLSESVKLATLLFVKFVLQNLTDADWSDDELASKREQVAAKTLQVVGLLLQGPMKVLKKQKAEERQAGGKNEEDCVNEQKFPPQLEDFVYQHFKEDEFLPMLCPQEEACCPIRLQHHFLSALSPLDPARLPRTAKFVGQQLLLACRGRGEAFEAAHPQPRLQALLRIGTSWHLLSEAMEIALENIVAAATKLSSRKPISSEDVLNVLAVMELAFRDPVVRSAVLQANASQTHEMVRTASASFCKIWSAGVAKLQKLKVNDDQPLLGPSAHVWPRLLGLTTRVALHLQHRLPSQATTLDDGSVETSVVGVADEALFEIAGVLTAEPTREVLQRLVAAEESRLSDEPQKKKPRVSSSPADVSSILHLHKRLLEAFNVAAHLAPSVEGVPEDEQQGWSSTGAKELAGALIDSLRQWSGIADKGQPRLEEPLLTSRWLSQKLSDPPSPGPSPGPSLGPSPRTASAAKGRSEASSGPRYQRDLRDLFDGCFEDEVQVETGRGEGELHLHQEREPGTPQSRTSVASGGA